MERKRDDRVRDSSDGVRMRVWLRRKMKLRVKVLMGWRRKMMRCRYWYRQRGSSRRGCRCRCGYKWDGLRYVKKRIA